MHQYRYDRYVDTVYKHQNYRWTTFGRIRPNSRRFRQLGMLVNNPSADSVPIQVIEGARYLIVVDIEQYTTINTDEVVQDDNAGIVDGIIGKYEVDETQLEELHSGWHNPECQIVAATDGGLKDRKGTSSYAFFLPNNARAILMGYAGEYQPRRSASSTRQELLGQLALECWLHRFAERWGVPRGKLTIDIITDSQASIDIMENVPRITGITDTLRAEMDVALELNRQRNENWWIQRDMIKVESHIEKIQAPNEFYWECNEIADALATSARERFSLEELRTKPSLVLLGTRAICMIDGCQVNNDLQQVLQEKLMGDVLKQFLMEKYGWNNSIFHAIAWEAHQAELQRISIIQRPTLIKYIHGWLATTKRRFREGAHRDHLCPLCGGEESQQHYLRCSNETMTLIRESQWKYFKNEVIKSTETGCCQVFLAGLDTIHGHPPPSRATREDWPSELREAYIEQESIGWDHVVFGRISRLWETVANTRNRAENGQTSRVWTKTVIRLGWKYGTTLWQTRNSLVHGTDGICSMFEQSRINAVIQVLYSDLRPEVTANRQEIFSLPESEMTTQPYQSQIAWLEKIKFLFPERYNEIEQATVGKIQTELDLELQCKRRSGYQGWE